MIKIGIIGENFQNDACAFKAFMTPQYKDKITFVPLLKSLNGGTLPVDKIGRMLPVEIQKKDINVLLCMLDLDKEINRTERNKCFKTIEKSIKIKSIFFLVLMELEALILADINEFNSIYGVDGNYTKKPKFEANPKQVLTRRTEKGKRKYNENDAEEIFNRLHFDVVYKNHSGEDSFQEFIDNFEHKLKLKN